MLAEDLHDPRRLGVDTTWMRHTHGVIGEIRHDEGAPQQPAIGVGVRAHAPVALGCLRRDFGPQQPVAVEELLRPIAAHPLLEQFDVLGLIHFPERDLMGPPVTLRLEPVDIFWPGPALWAAQDDHRPLWAPGGLAVAGIYLNRSDLVERRV